MSLRGGGKGIIEAKELQSQDIQAKQLQNQDKSLYDYSFRHGTLA
jgi:hypothetical protein